MGRPSPKPEYCSKIINNIIDGQCIPVKISGGFGHVCKGDIYKGEVNSGEKGKKIALVVSVYPYKNENLRAIQVASNGNTGYWILSNAPSIRDSLNKEPFKFKRKIDDLGLQFKFKFT